MLKRTKIICTLGPAVDDDHAVGRLIEEGMDVARLNFSHGSHAEHAERIARLKRVRDAMGSPCALLLDTKGPEIRTGRLPGQPVRLEEGARITLTTRECEGSSERSSKAPRCFPATWNPARASSSTTGSSGFASTPSRATTSSARWRTPECWDSASR